MNDMDDEDGLRAARGIVRAVAAGAVLWTLAALVVLVLSGCGSADEPPKPAQCWCSKPVFNAVTGRYDRQGSEYQCACGSEEHRRYGR
jgi:hypothetical protein